jgi:lipid A 4'-phosphatase
MLGMAEARPRRWFSGDLRALCRSVSGNRDGLLRHSVGTFGFASTMKQKAPYVPRTVWIWFLTVSLLFVAAPGIDLGLSELFYEPGVGFPVNGTWYEGIVYESVEYAMVLVNVGLIIAWIYGRFSAKGAKPVSGRELAFLLLLLALGPGLVVNLAMKEHWGRARPADLTQFGGTKEFTPAFVPSDQGGHSFPSGHAAAAFYLVAVAYVVAGRKRLWMRILLEYCVLVGFFRIAAGGHFLSDVVTSLFVVLILFFFLYRVMFGRAPSL